MDELFILDDLDKSILLACLSYISLRIAIYGEQRLDRIVLMSMGLLMLFVLALTWIADIPQVLSITTVLAIGWLIVIIWSGGIPGLMIHWPEGKKRMALWVEVLVVIAGILIISQFLGFETIL